MLDRVKESCFNIIRSDVPGARALDLFSGSGALGLEALSRGAESCIFVEQNLRLAQLILRNAEKCNLADRSQLVQADVLDLPRVRPPASGLPASLVFVDPPYALMDDPDKRTALLRVLEELAGAWISDSALLVLHHRPIPDAVWPGRRLRERDKRIYGQSQLTLLELGPEGAHG